ncbi:MAG: hypothetical protein IKE03_02265, partial [Blautia sp.]|nr:hypothetical protein [Blautia sp.]
GGLSHMIGGRTQPKTDFSQGPVWRRILDQAGPLIVAQLVQRHYYVVPSDKCYCTSVRVICQFFFLSSQI